MTKQGHSHGWAGEGIGPLCSQAQSLHSQAQPLGSQAQTIRMSLEWPFTGHSTRCNCIKIMLVRSVYWYATPVRWMDHLAKWEMLTNSASQSLGDQNLSEISFLCRWNISGIFYFSSWRLEPTLYMLHLYFCSVHIAQKKENTLYIQKYGETPLNEWIWLFQPTTADRCLKSMWHRHRMLPFQQVSSSNFCPARAAQVNCKCCYCEVETSRSNNSSAAKW